MTPEWLVGGLFLFVFLLAAVVLWMLFQFSGEDLAPREPMKPDPTLWNPFYRDRDKE